MPDFSGMFGTMFDLMLVVIGFGLIIFVHELGHFVAARWAGIRVLAFALGFGPAAFSYRKGLGLRRGSSEVEYAQRMRARAIGVTTAEGMSGDALAISSTEYRLNWLPFGGYVKMLGQEDLNPDAVSEAPDSYQRCVPWKKMIVICAGVVMNMITAAILFMIVFSAGLRTEPPIVGQVAPGEPAAVAIATNASAAGVHEPGLLPGDEIVMIDGRAPRQFSDVAMAAAMASRGRAIDLTVRRSGVEEPLQFSITPEANSGSRLLGLGIYPARSSTLLELSKPSIRGQFDRLMSSVGLEGVKPGMELVSINGVGPVLYANQLQQAADASNGKPLQLVFTGADGAKIERAISPQPEFQREIFTISEGLIGSQQHFLGLTGVLRVSSDATEDQPKQGLAPGDVFVRLGAVEFPSIEAGIREIRSNVGREIEAVVRRQEGNAFVDVPLKLRVSREGTIGFRTSDTMETSTLVGCPVAFTKVATKPAAGASDAASSSKVETLETAAGKAQIQPGSRIVSVNGKEVSNFAQIRAAVLSSVRDGGTVELMVQPPHALGTDGLHAAPLALAVSDAEVKKIRSLGWTSPLPADVFEPSQILLKSTGPLNAISLGLSETRRMVLQVYLTFGRLFEGTLKIQHLQGPVGIAHVGTLLADRGFIWLLFFLAMVSVNLAVVNFLPLPIVDGGQFLFILYEQFFKKPVPVAFQNAATLAGLILIGSMFLIVTFNDITNLFRS